MPLAGRPPPRAPVSSAVGSLIAGVLVALVALANASPTAALNTVAFPVVCRFFEDYLLNLRVLRKTVDVSPLVTIVVVILGGSGSSAR